MLEHRGISAGAKLCYIRLLGFAGKDARCYPSLETLGASLGVSDRQARDYVKELERQGFIVIEQRGLRKTNVYLFVWTEELDRLMNAVPDSSTDPDEPETGPGSGSPPDRNDGSGQGPELEFCSRPEQFFRSRPEVPFRSHKNKFIGNKFTGIIFLLEANRGSEDEEDERLRINSSRTGCRGETAQRGSRNYPRLGKGPQLSEAKVRSAARISGRRASGSVVANPEATRDNGVAKHLRSCLMSLWLRPRDQENGATGVF